MQEETVLTKDHSHRTPGVLSSSNVMRWLAGGMTDVSSNHVEQDAFHHYPPTTLQAGSFQYEEEENCLSLDVQAHGDDHGSVAVVCLQSTLSAPVNLSFALSEREVPSDAALSDHSNFQMKFLEPKICSGPRTT
jgi:hypothetical protein